MAKIDDLPQPSAQRLSVRVTKDALRQLRGRHPWIFDSSIESINRAGSPGELAVIFGPQREFVAIGLYDPDSPIAIRVLHTGKPRQIDDDFWAERIGAACSGRSELIASPATTAFRLVNGENDGLGGLIIDVYEKTAVIKVYSEAWFPYLRAVTMALQGTASGAGLEIDTVLVRFSRQVRSGQTYGFSDGDALIGVTPTEPQTFLENGLTFEADLVSGQKTGHFLDQRENRAAVRSLSNNRRVLDVFSCTGGFSINAAAGGAHEVVSIDLSKRSVATAARNIELNMARPNVERCNFELLVGDAFETMARMASRGEAFDMVIVDPPSFAHSSRDREAALDSYRRLTQLGIGLTTPGGFFVQSSCSSRISSQEFRDTVVDEISASGRDARLHEETGHAVDHPVGFPQGAYLKTLFFRMDPK